MEIKDELKNILSTNNDKFEKRLQHQVRTKVEWDRRMKIQHNETIPTTRNIMKNNNAHIKQDTHNKPSKNIKTNHKIYIWNHKGDNGRAT